MGVLRRVRLGEAAASPAAKIAAVGGIDGRGVVEAAPRMCSEVRLGGRRGGAAPSGLRHARIGASLGGQASPRSFSRCVDRKRERRSNGDGRTTTGCGAPQVFRS